MQSQAGRSEDASSRVSTVKCWWRSDYFFQMSGLEAVVDWQALSRDANSSPHDASELAILLNASSALGTVLIVKNQLIPSLTL